MLINVFRGTKLENLPENLEPHAHLDAPLRKIWSAPHVLRCAPEKNVEHPVRVEMRSWCFLREVQDHYNTHRTSLRRTVALRG